MALDHEVTQITNVTDRIDLDDPRRRALMDGSGFSVVRAAMASGVEIVYNQPPTQPIDKPTAKHASRRGGRSYPEMGARDKALYDTCDNQPTATPVELSDETLRAKEELSLKLESDRVRRQLQAGVDPRLVAARQRARSERNNAGQARPLRPI